MVTESQARMDEYIEVRRLSQKAIIKEINDEKDKEIERLRKLVKQAYAEGWDDCDDDEMTGEEAFEGSIVQQALKGE